MLNEPKESLFVALTNPTPGLEAEYNTWYTNVHLKEVASVKGFISARRFKLTKPQYIADQPYQYVAIYKVQSDCAQDIIDNLNAASRLMHMSPALDVANGGGFLIESISDTVYPS